MDQYGQTCWVRPSVLRDSQQLGLVLLGFAGRLETVNNNALRTFLCFDLVNLAGGSGFVIACGFEKLHQYMHTMCLFLQLMHQSN